MRNAIVVDANDVKRILAEHFGVSPDAVVKSQYSYTVITDKNLAAPTADTTGGEG